MTLCGLSLWMLLPPLTRTLTLTLSQPEFDPRIDAQKIVLTLTLTRE